MTMQPPSFSTKLSKSFPNYAHSSHSTRTPCQAQMLPHGVVFNYKSTSPAPNPSHRLTQATTTRPPIPASMRGLRQHMTASPPASPGLVPSPASVKASTSNQTSRGYGSVTSPKNFSTRTQGLQSAPCRSIPPSSTYRR